MRIISTLALISGGLLAFGGGGCAQDEGAGPDGSGGSVSSGAAGSGAAALVDSGTGGWVTTTGGSGGNTDGSAGNTPDGASGGASGGSAGTASDAGPCNKCSEVVPDNLPASNVCGGNSTTLIGALVPCLCTECGMTSSDPCGPTCINGEAPNKACKACNQTAATGPCKTAWDACVADK